MSIPDRRGLLVRKKGGLSRRRQCALLGLARSGVYRKPKAANDNDLGCRHVNCGVLGVSFQQLTTALGIGAPSLYAAFGNKEALYREALDRYADKRVASDLSFMEGAHSAREAVRLLLYGTASGLVDPKGEVGCMLNTGMIANHPDFEGLARDLARRRARFRALLAETLQRWICRVQAEALSSFVTAVMQGMAIQARDGFVQDQLQIVVNGALQAIPDDMEI